MQNYQYQVIHSICLYINYLHHKKGSLFQFHYTKSWQNASFGEERINKSANCEWWILLTLFFFPLCSGNTLIHIVEWLMLLICVKLYHTTYITLFLLVNFADFHCFKNFFEIPLSKNPPFSTTCDIQSQKPLNLFIFWPFCFLYCSNK